MTPLITAPACALVACWWAVLVLTGTRRQRAERKAAVERRRQSQIRSRVSLKQLDTWHDRGRRGSL